MESTDLVRTACAGPRPGVGPDGPAQAWAEMAPPRRRAGRSPWGCGGREYDQGLRDARKELGPWPRWRSGWASPDDGRTGSTTSPSSPAGARGIPRTSTSRGRSTPTVPSCRCWRRPWTVSSRPATAIEIGRLGGAGVLNLEGLWTRYDDPDPLLEEIALLDAEKATRRMQDIYLAADPARAGHRAHPPDPRRRPDLRRLGHAAAHRPAPARHPGRRARHARHPGHRGVGQHVSKNREPLNLLKVIREMEIPVIVGGLRELPGRAPPHAHGRLRRPRRRRSRPRLHHPGVLGIGVPRPPRSPTPGPPGCATSTRPASTSTSSPTVAWPPGATSPRPSCAAPTPS